MVDNLVPAHVVFARWFIRVRWIATLLLILSTLILKSFSDIPFRDVPLYGLALILIILNTIHSFLLRYILLKGNGRIIFWIKKEIHLQIITDLIVLTLILHFSGGIENPLIIFFFFHMIIASSIFSPLNSYLHTIFALFLIALMVFLEYYGLIPHYHLEGLVSIDLYQNKFLLFGGGFIYISASIFLVSLTRMIISRSIKIEETYVKTNMELDRKDKLQNEYVLRVTHDIKGHLAAIISCLAVIRDDKTGPLNEIQEEFITRAYNRTNLLVVFVKGLLNLTRMRLKQDTEFEDFSIVDLIHSVVSSTRLIADEKSIEINLTIDKAIPTILGNVFTIEELYSNLLMNAVNYTPNNGRIDIIVRNRPDHIVTEISDTGIGIPKEEIPKIFNEFYRGSNVQKDKKYGSGLGLSIVKQIIHNHHGRIWVSSEPGHWTKFIFTLPKNPELHESLGQIDNTQVL